MALNAICITVDRCFLESAKKVGDHDMFGLLYTHVWSVLRYAVSFVLLYFVFLLVMDILSSFPISFYMYSHPCTEASLAWFMHLNASIFFVFIILDASICSGFFLITTTHWSNHERAQKQWWHWGHLIHLLLSARTPNATSFLSLGSTLSSLRYLVCQGNLQFGHSDLITVPPHSFTTTAEHCRFGQ